MKHVPHFFVAIVMLCIVCGFLDCNQKDCVVFLLVLIVTSLIVFIPLIIVPIYVSIIVIYDVINVIKENLFNKNASHLLSKDAIAHTDGLYIIECTGDYHMIREVYRFRKGERIWRYFEDEHEHYNSWAVVRPVNIKLVSEVSAAWKQGITAPVEAIYIIAYAFQGCSEAHYGYHATFDGMTELNIQCDKMNYAIIYAAQGDNFLYRLTTNSHILNSSNKDINWRGARVLSYYIAQQACEKEKRFSRNKQKRFFSRIIRFYMEKQKMYHP